jgi:hypothetical protein
MLMKLLTQAACVLAFSGVSSWANPLHGYCAGVGQCVDNGSNSPTTTNPPSNFGFTISGGPITGSTLLLDFLEPNNQAHASVAITGTYSGTASLFSATPWTSGFLDAYLGISASPSNPIGAFIPDPVDLGATGFFVYQLSISPIGGVTLQSPSNPNVSPLENITGTIPLGTYIVGFLDQGTASSPNWSATANSGAILEDTAPGSTRGVVPEPSSIILLGSVALGSAILLKRKTRSRGYRLD